MGLLYLAVHSADELRGLDMALPLFGLGGSRWLDDLLDLCRHGLHFFSHCVNLLFLESAQLLAHGSGSGDHALFNFLMFILNLFLKLSHLLHVDALLLELGLCVGLQLKHLPLHLQELVGHPFDLLVDSLHLGMSDDLCGPLLCFLDGSDLALNPANERSYVLAVLVDHDQLPLVIIGLELGDAIQLVVEGGLELLNNGLTFDELVSELRDVLLSLLLRELAGLNLDGHQV